MTNDIAKLPEQFAATFTQTLADHHVDLGLGEVGRVLEIADGYARIEGLPGAKAEELLRFPGGALGMVFDLLPDRIGAFLLDPSNAVHAGCEARRTGRVLDVPVGEALMGRVIDPVGRPLDGGTATAGLARRPVERPAYGVMDRAAVETPLQTGLKVIDALIPIGRGQRELILGDRQTGKTAIAIDTILNQRDTGVLCVYCAIGQRSTAVARVIEQLRQLGAMEYTIVVAASGDNPPGMRFAAPYAATSVAEFFMEQGRNVLVIHDDLTRHARAYRELSLLARRPPGREAYPGDIFYIHARLLERATHLKESLGGGSLTALPIVETQAENISAYIPTNLVSITDGQVFLSSQLFRQGVLPAVDVGRSVSRVGGKAQLPAYRAVAGDLRLAYSQFVELERFSRYGARLDDETRKSLEHGRRVREILQQPQFDPVPVAEQIVALLAVGAGAFDAIPPEEVPQAEQVVRSEVVARHGSIIKRLLSGEKPDKETLDQLVTSARESLG